MNAPGLIAPGDFGGPTVPDWLLRRPEISPGAKLVYAILAANTCGPDFPEFELSSGLDQKKMAHKIGASERSIRNWLKELGSAGLIRYEVSGWGKPNLYFFLKHPWQRR
jgi:hypothetical protein